jgi:hypothetical protein
VKQVAAVCCRIAVVLLLAVSVTLAQNNNGNNGNGNGPKKGAKTPNILFIIMDDVGIDQMTIFGYGGTDAAKTPNIDAIATAGVRFRNVWAKIKPNGRYPDIISTAFYQINQDKGTPKLDDSGNALCGDSTPDCFSGTLPQDQQAIFNNLSNAMTALLGSEPACPGDTNEDKVVNGQDIKTWRFFKQLTTDNPTEATQSSWADLNMDGLTDNADLAIIHTYIGTKCLAKK